MILQNTWPQQHAERKNERRFHSPAWNERVSSTESKRCFDNKWRRINDHKNKSERTKHKTSGGNGEKRPTETELHSHYWVVPVRERTGNVHTWFDTMESDAGTICSWDPVKRPPCWADRLVFVWTRGREQVAVGAVSPVGPVSVVFLRGRKNLVFVRAGFNVTAVILWHLGRL